MIVQHAVPGGPMGQPDRAMNRPSTDELDWDALYADLAPRVYNYFRYRLGTGMDVEELTSRTFERAWRSRAHYRQDLAGFSTWLFKIAQNVGIDYRSRLQVHLPLEAASNVALEATPELQAELSSDLARLANLTARLPERDRELIALKYGASLNNRLIAQVTGLSESNVGTILHRLVKSLRSQWYGREGSRDE
jgi:RNA polymerase sigma-70 factor, ECF subfamily